MSDATSTAAWAGRHPNVLPGQRAPCRSGRRLDSARRAATRCGRTLGRSERRQAGACVHRSGFPVPRHRGRASEPDVRARSSSLNSESRNPTAELRAPRSGHHDPGPHSSTPGLRLTRRRPRPAGTRLLAARRRSQAESRRATSPRSAVSLFLGWMFHVEHSGVGRQKSGRRVGTPTRRGTSSRPACTRRIWQMVELGVR